MVKSVGAAILAFCLVSISSGYASAQLAPQSVRDTDCYGETLEVTLGKPGYPTESEMPLSIPLELRPTVHRQREYNAETDPSQVCLSEPISAIRVGLPYSSDLSTALSLPEKNIGPRSIKITLGNAERSRLDTFRQDLMRRRIKQNQENEQLFLLDEGFLKTFSSTDPWGDYMPLYGMSDPSGSFMMISCNRAMNFGGWEFANCSVFYTLKNNMRVEYTFRYGDVAETVVPGSTPLKLWREVDASIRKLVLSLPREGKE